MARPAGRGESFQVVTGERPSNCSAMCAVTNKINFQRQIVQNWVRRRKSTGRSISLWSVALVLAVAVLSGCSVNNASAGPSPRAPAVLPISLTNEVAPPVPVITRGPPSLTYDTSAHFEFSDQGQYGGFQCRLDNAQFGPCGPGGIRYSDLGLGRHCFYVLAVRGGYRSAPRGFCWQCRPIRVSGGFTIGGNAPDLFYPGTSEPLDLALTNPFNFDIKVLSVSITVEPVPAKNGVPDPACPATSNLLVTRPLGATLTVPARSTKSLSDLGVPQAEWPVLTMPDLPTNQDACEGATFTLLYSGSATMGTPSPVQTWTVLVSFPDPSALGHAVTLTAIVAKSLGPGTLTGQVSFYSGIPDGPHLFLGKSSLNVSARATWATSGLGAGTDSLYAVYTGGTNFAASTSPVIFQLVLGPRATRSLNFAELDYHNPGQFIYLCAACLLSGHVYRLLGGGVVSSAGRHFVPKYRHLAPKEKRHVRHRISWRRKKHAAPSRVRSGAVMARRTAMLAGLVVLAGVGFAGLASAGFIVPGSGSGTATVISLSAPAEVTVSQITATASDPSGEQVNLEALDQTAPAVAALGVSWDPVAIPSGGTGGYFVQRFAGDRSTPSAACGSSPTSPLDPATTACTDSGLVPGTSYRYQVIAVYDTLVAPSALSDAVSLSASALSSFTLTPSISAPTAGTPFSVTVTALDQYGDTYSAYTGPQCVTFSGPADGPDGSAPTYPAKVRLRRR